LVAQAEPDGYTLIQITMGMLSISPVMPGVPMPFDPDKDLVPVIKTAGLYNILVMDPKLPFTTVQALIDYTRANPGKLAYASSGNGSSQHLAGELFKSMAGIDMLHVPYRGATPAVLDITGGQVCCMFTNLPDILGQIQGGQLRAVAYGSVPGSKVVPAPTVAESGVPGFSIDNWFGIGTPKGTPQPIVDRLNTELNRIIASPEGNEKLSSLGFMPFGGTQAQLRDAIIRDRAKWGALIKAQGIKAE
jgi:tripartite-type tricarboxylate transporter receptor subunit TctC